MTITGKRFGDWVQTFSGRQFWPLDPHPDEVDIHDIAHSLSMQCRFAGHCTHFYSVAEHSVLVSHVVPPELALLGLLHDATEAYVVDVPRPLKRHLTGYATAEDGVWSAIAGHFGLPIELPQAVKDADDAVLLAEARQIMGPPPSPWSVPGEPADVAILCLSPNWARDEFLRRFTELTGKA